MRFVTDHCKPLGPELANVLVTDSMKCKNEYSLKTNKEGEDDLKGKGKFLYRKAGSCQAKSPAKTKHNSKGSSYGEVSFHNPQLVCLQFTSNWMLSVATNGDHDKNKHDPVKDVDH